ncbi:hypothetical protein BDF20DRAFT_834225 [Mycotypha africana]|uniref:uncharacterized protein n=1 Tax=Mycotypha africana TaxID=64632 RepID=UPI002300AB95|nr:uncharacterized protein BDF20DRAFT_834225 [Mycotypha africana]KAI8984734.1 hypothetical protein BDF20DRAFT_834225 [Mycotypha africana]
MAILLNCVHAIKYKVHLLAYGWMFWAIREIKVNPMMFKNPVREGELLSSGHTCSCLERQSQLFDGASKCNVCIIVDVAKYESVCRTASRSKFQTDNVTSTERLSDDSTLRDIVFSYVYIPTSRACHDCSCVCINYQTMNLHLSRTASLYCPEKADRTTTMQYSKHTLTYNSGNYS